MRRLDAAFLLGLILNSRLAERSCLACGSAWTSKMQGGVEPPHSKALRAFSWFLAGWRRHPAFDVCEVRDSEPVARKSFARRNRRAQKAESWCADPQVSLREIAASRSRSLRQPAASVSSRVCADLEKRVCATLRALPGVA